MPSQIPQLRPGVIIEFLRSCFKTTSPSSSSHQNGQISTSPEADVSAVEAQRKQASPVHDKSAPTGGRSEVKALKHHRRSIKAPTKTPQQNRGTDTYFGDTQMNPYLHKDKQKIDCRIIPLYDGDQPEFTPLIQVDWFATISFEEIDSAAKRLLREKFGIPEAKQLYLKSGRCLLIDSETNKAQGSVIVDSSREWQTNVPPLIGAHLGEDTKSYIEMRLEYSALSLNEVEGESYADTVRKVVQSKFMENWENDKYISRVDLDVIYSDSTVKRLIGQDRSLKDMQLTPEKRRIFLDNVNAEATRILAICIQAEIPLSCLYHLVDKNGKGYRDADLPLPPSKDHCPGEEYEVKFEQFLLTQRRFVPHVFVNVAEGAKLEELKDNLLLPYTQAEKLGQGGFGEVYKIHIHPDHHYFSSDRNAPLALKKFYQYPQVRENVTKEEAVLRQLAEDPHDHITPHLAAWTQKDHFYILFPCAATNLHKFLFHEPSRDLSTEFVQWLLYQLRGIADAVRNIHMLGPSKLTPKSLLPPDRMNSHKRTGYHHDIKPENILVFAKDNVGPSDPKITEYVLKISDFGLARINTILSGTGAVSYRSPNLSAGDPIYGPPDRELEGGASRPYDMWSLGCVFLEVLSWTFDIGGPDGIQEFARQRLKVSGNQPGVSQSSAFWNRNSNGEYVRNSAVDARLRQLSLLGDRRPVFKHVISGIDDMLSIKPEDRPKAQDVHNVLDAACKQARFDVRNQPETYEQDPHGYQLFASPTTLRDNSSRPSLEQEAQHSLSGENEESRDALAPRGHRSSSTRSRNEALLGVSDMARSSDPSQGITLEIQTATPRRTRSRSPAISISHHDDQTTPERRIHDAIDGDTDAPAPLIGAHAQPVGREDIAQLPPLGRNRTGGSQSI